MSADEKFTSDTEDEVAQKSSSAAQEEGFNPEYDMKHQFDIEERSEMLTGFDKKRSLAD